MPQLSRLSYQLDQADNFVLFEDWEGILKLTDGPWSKLVAESGSCAVADGLFGILGIDPSGGSPAASDEAYVYTTTQCVEPQAGYPAYFEALVQFAQVNVNQAGIFVGIASGVSAGGLITALSAGIRSTGTVIGFYCATGSTNWNVIAQINGTTYTQATSIPAGLTTYQKLSFEILDELSTTAGIVFRIDDQLVKNVNTPQVPLKIEIPLSGAVLCSLVAGVKNGATVTSGHEQLYVDYIGWVQSRIVGADG